MHLSRPAFRIRTHWNTTVSHVYRVIFHRVLRPQALLKSSPQNSKPNDASQSPSIVLPVTEMSIPSLVSSLEIQARPPQTASQLLRLSEELLQTVLQWLFCPIDLLHTSHSCSALMKLTDEREWFRVYCIMFPTWSLGCSVSNLCGEYVWMRIVLREYRLKNRLMAPSPADFANMVSRTDSPFIRTSPALVARSNHFRIRLEQESCHIMRHLQLTTGSLSEFRRVGTPLYHLLPATGHTMAASILARPLPESQSFDYRVVISSFPELDRPISTFGSESWTENDVQDQPWYGPYTPEQLPIAQVIDIVQFPKKDPQSRSRILIALAFGPNSAPPTAEGTRDTQILDLWLLVKVMEFWVPDEESADRTLLQGQISTVTLQDFRGRGCKIFRVLDPLMDLERDCVALFGIRNSETSSAMVIQQFLFSEPGQSSPPRTETVIVGKEISCLTVFPVYSGYERMMVLFKRNGEGFVWDWVNHRAIARLQSQKSQALALNPLQVADSQEEEGMYHWGVQVSRAIEPSLNYLSIQKEETPFRITVLADGVGQQWKSCWWTIDRKVLGSAIVDLQALNPTLPSSEPFPLGQVNTIEFSTRERFERGARGIEWRDLETPQAYALLPTPTPTPTYFIAFVIYGHYRICLTSRLGICLADLESEPSGEEEDEQWITLVQDEVENPLIDIATVGDYLIITRRHSYLIWSFLERRIIL